MFEGPWSGYQFIPECCLDEENQNLLRQYANRCRGSAFCPYYLCLSQWKKICPEETACKCREKCNIFYEKYIREEKK